MAATARRIMRPDERARTIDEEVAEAWGRLLSGRVTPSVEKLREHGVRRDKQSIGRSVARLVAAGRIRYPDGTPNHLRVGRYETAPQARPRPKPRAIPVPARIAPKGPAYLPPVPIEKSIQDYRRAWRSLRRMTMACPIRLKGDPS